MRAINRSGASNSARVPDWEQLRYRVVADIACGAAVVACAWNEGCRGKLIKVVAIFFVHCSKRPGPSGMGKASPILFVSSADDGGSGL